MTITYCRAGIGPPSLPLYLVQSIVQAVPDTPFPTLIVLIQGSCRWFHVWSSLCIF